MLDFLRIKVESKRSGPTEICPNFIIKKSKDLMIKGGDFFAIWVEERGLWSTDEDDVLYLIDKELDEFVDTHGYDRNAVYIKYIRNSESGVIDSWHRYCQKQLRDNWHPLDTTIIFSNTNVTKESYATKKLNYALEEGDISAYDTIMSTLYSEEERKKIEWAIGSIICGDSQTIQKFIVLYGAPKTGKSTVLNIIQKLFEGYYCVFDAKAIGSSNNSFALEAFRNDPIVAIQHDGDLSKIEDNTKLNSIVSHETMLVNEKFKSAYPSKFRCFLFLGTNKPVKISDSKSGIIRRLIDVQPSGKKLSLSDYRILTKKVNFELGAIAYHCLNVYLSDKDAYDSYVPTEMMSASNDFYNFMLDSYRVFKENDGTTLKAAWEMYKVYSEEAKIPYPLQMRVFKEELKSYFWKFEESASSSSVYSGFMHEKFEKDSPKEEKDICESFLSFKCQKSIFDEVAKKYPAQYASKSESPTIAWSEVLTKLEDIDTSKLHYVKVPENHIVIDFDLKDENGEKSLEKNLEAANSWPKTYAELSKSGKGIHLHYIYTGDTSKLSRIFEEGIEVKVYSGNSALRRKLTKCNNLPISEISSNLPLKGEKKMINWDGVKSERILRSMIKKNLNKEYHPNTKPSIDYIYKLLDDAYTQGLKYDVSDLRNAITAFAASSTNKSEYCLDKVSEMHFKSDDASPNVENNDSPIIFYDVEVFPNLLVVVWKLRGKGNPLVKMINPTPKMIEDILPYRLIGFNCRKYDNHILYGKILGYDNAQLYELSSKIISGDKKAFFSEAYNISYTDIYDFCSKKQSLKKWEIQLGIHHQELGLPWDQPVPKELWEKVADYCGNDVIASEAVFEARQGDFAARKIQVELVKVLHGVTDVSVNDTTNSLSAKIIFGNNRNPQSVFNYRDLSKPVSELEYEEYRKKFGEDYIFNVFDDNGLPTYQTYDGFSVLPQGYSILPFFPGYEFKYGKSTFNDKSTFNGKSTFNDKSTFNGKSTFNDKSTFMGEEIGEGGRVYSEPGIYTDVWDGDINSQHPFSIISECLFGPEYTKIFKEIVEARIAIKHSDFDTAKTLLNGALAPFLKEDLAEDLAQALKIVINSIYGLTSASFSNQFRDPRNVDNIVAKRGNLFMTLLKSEVQKRGYTVCHIKTDSIKIPNADESIKNFVIKFGREFGYIFETEADFSKFCLVNDAVYIAKHKTGKKAGSWSATGAQFAVPYVFKTLFSKEQLVFEDFCETFAVSKGNIYLDMNEGYPDVSEYEKLLDKNTKALKKGTISEEEYISTKDELAKLIAKGHNYIFVGRVGQFCPVKTGSNGGVMYRVNDGKYYATPGSTGYRWLESEMVQKLEKEDLIDKEYYRKLVDEAVDTISKFGDFEAFVADDEDDETPPFDIESTDFDKR